MNILVIHSASPDGRNLADQRLMWTLRGLRKLGHDVTFVARDAANSARGQAALQELNIKTYGGDSERLRAFGRDLNPSGWSLQDLLAKNQFALAILTQNFRWGISIPEHYLDDIRRHSPETRLVILVEQLYGGTAARRFDITHKLEHNEIAQDWSTRELEAFRRADLVAVNHRHEAELLHQGDPNMPVHVLPMPLQTVSGESDWRRRNGILFPIDLKEPGDVDAFVWFLEKVWAPISQKSTSIELLVAGGDAIPLESRRRLVRVQWLPAEDLAQLAATARLFVCPQRFGTTNQRCLQMMASGLPGITTAFVAETLGLATGAGILIADTPEQFSSGLLRIYDDRKFGKDLAARGCECIAQEYSGDQFTSQLVAMLIRVAQSPGKPAASQPFSATLVDPLFSAVLGKAPADQRIGLRLDAHIQLAEQLLRDAKPEMARDQLRHVCSWLGESVKANTPFARLLSLLTRCYRELGDETMAARCREGARHCFSSQLAPVPPPSAPPAVRTKRQGPQISLIIPSYNRLPILKKCLRALEAQTVSPALFEVIVIDDGSTDGTDAAMPHYKPAFPFQYLRQTNSGTGAARRNGVEHATGEYLLLMNDDTICDPDLIERHFQMRQELGLQRWAILGNFEYPAEARQRALTHFLKVGSFMFPQIDMEPGCPYPYSHFITCNLSVRRDAVVQAGSFDSTYKLSEDTELGLRLFEMGYGVIYHPAAHAWHDHLPYKVANLIRRARVYGADYFYMFRRHPRVVKEWGMPVNLAGPAAATAERIATYLEQNRRDVEAAVAALQRWDDVDFEPILADPRETAHVLALFQQAVPPIHWFYLFEKMLETMRRELSLNSVPAHSGA